MEKEKINVAEILRNCQAGINLDCVCFENVVFDRVDDKNRIRCFVGSQRDEVSFNEYGCLNGSPSAKCVIFPKGEATWAGFQVPFKDGDMLIGKAGQPFIFKKRNNFDSCSSYCGIDINGKFHLESVDWTFAKSLRFATEAEKQKLFDAIRANGYKWDAETKTLEKLPKFKVGDWVVNIDEKVNQVVAIDDNCDGFTLDDGSHCNNAWNKLYRLWTIQDVKDGDVLVHCNCTFVFMGIKDDIVQGICTEIDNTLLNFGNAKYENDYTPATKEQRDLLFHKMKDAGYTIDFEKKELKKLIPNKFDITTLKPFDKALMRDSDSDMWCAVTFSHTYKRRYYCVCGWYNQCIPYEGNEHLLGSTDSCADYYKTWE